MNIGIIGYGRFGKLLASLMPSYFSVAVYEPSELRDKSVPRVDSLDALCHRSDWVFFCVPMTKLESALTEAAPLLRPGTVVFDVCSLKTFAVELLKKHVPAHCEIVATHPLFGPQSYSDDKLNHWAVCNVSGKLDTIKTFEEFCRNNFIKSIHCLPDEHDREMALSQAMTHFIGRAADRMGMDRITLSTQSFDDMMDIVELVKGGSAELFDNMQRMNPYAADARKLFLDSANALDAELRTDKVEA